ncbi:MAG: DUF2341 domain-containing protein, partial [Promethearchaeota archaeon]
MLISLLDSDLHDDVQSTGNDIAFADNTGWLDHEIELFKQDYNSTHAKLVTWVRVPSLFTSLDTKLSLYYGNETMSPRENPEGVWNTNYQGVWHLSEDPTDSSPAFKDSTPNNNDGTDYGSMTSGDQVPGQIDGSLDFDGGDDYLEVNDSSSLTIPGSFTVSAWINTNDLPPDGDLRSVVGKGMSSDNPGENHNYGIMLENAILTAGQAIEVYYEPSTGFGNAVAASWVTSLSLGQWYHVVGVHDAGADTLTLFVNGVQRAQNTGATATPDTGNAPLRIADVNVDIFPNEFNGQIDEVRVSNTVRNANWIQTEYNNQKDPNSFYSIGKEKSVSGHPSNAHYFAYYKEIVIEHSMVYGSNDLLNFSVLISILDSDLKDHVNSSSGNDIAFAYNEEWLDHELELFNQTYNETHAQLVAWVRIPLLSASLDTIIRMYYGNSTMGLRENPEGVWDSNYKGVWHLSESTGGTDAIKDSTINGNDGTDYGSPTFGSKGKSDGGIDFKGDIEDEYVQLPANASLNGINEGDYYTYEAWFYPDQVPPGVPINNNSRRYGIMIKRNPHQGLYYDHDQYFAMEHWLDIGGTPTVRAVSSGTYGPGKYYHIVAVVSNLDGYLKLYVNGNLEDQTTWTGGTTPWDYDIGALRIGIANPGWSTFRWAADGKIDEIRISDNARSADWIKTEYKNQNDPSSFYSISKEYPLSGILPNNHYFKYHKEITIDYTMVSGSHDLANFPLLFSIFDTDLQ